MTDPPLRGIRVLDLSTFLAGPFGTQILADLGAEVLKVEAPAGDFTRTMPPHFHEGESAYFMSINRSKQGLVVDLTSHAGRSVFYELVGRSDVVVDNYRPGTTAKLGVDYETLSAVNQRIICCSISGFGQDGPYSDRPAYDMIIQAMSGGMSVTGEVGGRPVRSGIPIGDLNAGQFAVTAILAALWERERSGAGQFIDISMLDVQIAMLSYLGVYHLSSGEIPGPQGRGHASIPTYTSLVVRDGRDVLICANTERMWRDLCSVLGLDELTEDPRFTTNERRYAHREELDPLLQKAAARYTSSDLVDRLRDAGIPSARVNNLSEALEDPQVNHREMVRTVEHTLGGAVRLLGNPIKFSRSSSGEFVSPPTLGEHTDATLGSVLGYSKEQLGQLRDQGAFGPYETAGDRDGR
jgi:CoA:oxalate CoA-transferase